MGYSQSDAVNVISRTLFEGFTPLKKCSRRILESQPTGLIQEAWRRILKPVPTDKICTYCFMNKQYVEWIQKRKKSYLIMVSTINITERGVNVFTVQRTKKRSRWVLGLSFDNVIPKWHIPSSNGENYLLSSDNQKLLFFYVKKTCLEISFQISELHPQLKLIYAAILVWFGFFVLMEYQPL